MRRHPLSFLFACAVCVAAGRVQAADVTFQLVGQLATDAASDLAFSGKLDRAYAFGTSSGVALNGIVFAPFASNSHGDSTNLSASSKFTDGGLTGGYASLVSN